MNDPGSAARAESARIRARGVGHAGRPWHIQALVLLLLSATLTVGIDGCRSTSSGGGTLLSGAHRPDAQLSSDSGSVGDGSSQYVSAPSPQPPSGGDDSSTDALAVDDLEVYAVSGNRLYYLSDYRGLLVFDVTDIDHPVLLGNSPIAGAAQAIYPSGNRVALVYSDVYETTAQGKPFHGSAVRVVDCTDPTHIQQLGEVTFAGQVQDSRLVGSMLYAVGTNRDAPYGSFMSQNRYAFVTSIDVSAGAPRQVDAQTIAGDDALFDFAPGAIVVSTAQQKGTASASGQIQYVDISDPAGAIKLRGAIATGVLAPTSFSGYCANASVWAIDFADGVHAHVVGGPPPLNNGASLVTVDFTNPDGPKLASTVANLLAPGDAQGVMPRFDVDPTAGRAVLYVAHSGRQDAAATSLDVYDLSNPASPQSKPGSTFEGDICSLQRVGSSLITVSSTKVDSTSVGLDIRQFDVTNPFSMKLLGSVVVTGGRDVFPAVDAPRQIVVDPTGALALVAATINPLMNGPYANAVDVVSLGSMTLPVGAASVTDRVVRAMFVQNRVYVLSAQGATIFDITQPISPRQTGTFTFSPYVAAVQPMGSVVAVASSDPEGIVTTTDLRILPIADANDPVRWAAAKPVTLPSSSPAMFSNGSLLYLATSDTSYTSGASSTALRITAVDASSGAPVTRGSVSFPGLTTGNPYGSAGYGDRYTWMYGPDIVQLAGTTLAIRLPSAGEPLHVVDLANPDMPTVADVAIGGSSSIWWGNLRLLGGALYATTADGSGAPCNNMSPGLPPTNECKVAYHLVPIDVQDPAHPSAGAPISVPGIAFGASDQDPSTVYFVDYQWAAPGQEVDEIRVCKLASDGCELLATLPLQGLVGQPYEQNDGAYVTVNPYDFSSSSSASSWGLHHIDLTNPSTPVDGMPQAPFSGWGTLFSLSGDAALVNSGWGSGDDVYRLDGTNQSPVYVQTLRATVLSAPQGKRQSSTVYFPAGNWGVAAVVAP